MRLAVISVTERGRLLSRRLPVEAERFCHERHCDAQAQAFASISTLAEALFPQYDGLIFLCAAGIAVRAVAPLLRSKATDPAVVVMDDGGQFVIPLLSGHLGGANALAKRIAEGCGAQAVITTATDSAGAFSPDCYAMERGLALRDLSAAKAVAAAVLDGEAVGFVSRLPGFPVPEGLSTAPGCRTGICICEEAEDRPFPVTLQLMPKNLAIGIGCKKGTSAEAIAALADRVCTEHGLWPERLAICTTIDRKEEEPGLLAFCRERRLTLLAFPAEMLMAVEGDFTASDFVLQTTGADNICERSACACGGRLLIRKTAANGVTAAISVLPMAPPHKKED